jgi:hypothetical protein
MAVLRRCRAHLRDQLRQLGNVPRVLVVLVRDAIAGAGRACLNGRMHEGVLVGEVPAAQGQEPKDALLDLCDFRVIHGVHAADGQQGVRHEGAQGLVDACVHVEARRLGSAHGMEFFRGDLHGLLSLGRTASVPWKEV